MHRGPEAIIFDFDGVMFDTEQMHGQAFVDVLAGYDIAVDLEAGIREFIGRNDRSIVEVLRARYPILEAISVDELVEEKTQRYAELTDGGLTPTRGLREFIELWVGRAKLGICSGSRTREIERLLKLADLRAAIEVIVSSDDVQASKPAPDGFEMARMRLAGSGNLDPARCVVFEDSAAGAQAARAAGMPVIGIRTNYVDAAELKTPVVIDDFTSMTHAQTAATNFSAAGVEVGLM